MLGARRRTLRQAGDAAVPSKVGRLLRAELIGVAAVAWTRASARPCSRSCGYGGNSLVPAGNAATTPSASSLARSRSPAKPAAGQAAVRSADQALVKPGCRTYGDHVEVSGGPQLFRLRGRRRAWLLTSRRQPITTRPVANISHGISTTRSAAVKFASLATGATGRHGICQESTPERTRGETSVAMAWRRTLHVTSRLHRGFTPMALRPAVMEATTRGYFHGPQDRVP